MGLLSFFPTQVEQKFDRDINFFFAQNKRNNSNLVVAQWTEVNSKVRIIMDEYNVVIEIPDSKLLPSGHWSETLLNQWKAIFEQKDQYDSGFPNFAVLKKDEAHPGKAIFFGMALKKYKAKMFERQYGSECNVEFFQYVGNC